MYILTDITAVNLFQEFGYIHLSAGDLLRAERTSGSENGDLIETCITEGKIVPVEITISLIEKVTQIYSSSFQMAGYRSREFVLARKKYLKILEKP